MKATGIYISVAAGEEPFRAFVPHPLPPSLPSQLVDRDYDLMEKANHALGRLDGISALLPNVSLFLYFYVRKEAVLSSQIEGTQSSFSDLLLHEEHLTPGVPLDDVQEVSNYVAAMAHGLKRLREDKFPLSLRLIKEIHAILLMEGRGSKKTPGDFRQSQNWIGGTRPGNAHFVPPPPQYVLECMGQLEKFLHDQPADGKSTQPLRTPVLFKAALAHAQFETIHPFLDGNGRLGRLLITLILCAENVLAEPLLYLSLYFKQNRPEYYERLDAVRFKGDWLGWLRFFMEGVLETAQQATVKARAILKLFEEDVVVIESLGKQMGSTRRLLDHLRRKPYITVPLLAAQFEITAPTARKLIQLLEQAGILKEVSGKQRNRIYAYHRYIELLREGTEPLPLANRT